MSLNTAIEFLQPYRWWILYATGGLIVLYVLQRMWLAVVRFIRRRRPPTIHPLLAKYNQDHAELDRRRREMAQGILATSTGNRLAGFKVMRQVEAVFVEGYRTPEEAVIALKAAAVERGANAILNVATSRTAAGRCTASGDAIVAATIQPMRRPAPPAPEAMPPVNPPPTKESSPPEISSKTQPSPEQPPPTHNSQ